MPSSTRQYPSDQDSCRCNRGLSLVTVKVLSDNVAANMEEMWKYDKIRYPTGTDRWECATKT
jgi:hypothetical protein